MRRTVAATLATLALSVVLAAPAFAGKPTIESFADSDAFDIDCGTFLLHETLTFAGSTKTWFDRNGVPTRSHTHVTFDGVITGAGGIRVLADRANFNEFVDLRVGGATRQVGIVYKFQVPGHGVIAQDVGSITFNADGSVDVKGPHDVFESGLEALICPYFQ